MKRIVHLDIAKSLAMFLVIFGHIIVTYDSRGYAAPIAGAIYSFHTALFMFVSGWFFSNVLNKESKVVVIDKARQLLLPYFSWSVLVLLFQQIPESGFDVRGCLYDFIQGGALRNYWYIKLLFIYILTTYFAIKLIRNKWIACAAVWLLFSILPSFSFSNIFIPFFLSAFLLRGFVEKHDGWCWIVGYAVLAILLYLLWQPSFNYTGLSIQIIPYLVRTLIGIDVSCLVITLLKKLLLKVEGSKVVCVFSYVGTITLGLYVAHFLFYEKVFWKWLMDMLPQDNVLIYLVYAIGAFVLSVILVSLISKNKYLAFFLLGKKITKDNI